MDSIVRSASKLIKWIKTNNYQSYDPFDGLKSPLSKYFTFNNKLLRIAWQQFFKRCPINLRPIVKIRKGIVSKTMGDLASACALLYRIYKDKKYLNEAVSSLKWLENNSYTSYSGSCWGIGFEYQSRAVHSKKGTPNMVTTYYNANGFLDAFELLGDYKYLEIAKSACNFMLKDLGFTEGNGFLCLNYYPNLKMQIHNANMLGAALLAEVYKYTKENELIKVARNAVKYTMEHQGENGSWFYGEEAKYRWIDNFHTGYVLESLYNYIHFTGDTSFMPNLRKGTEFYETNLFLSDGTPKYYHNKTYPIDIQCAAQAVQTFAIMSNIDKKYLDMAIKIAKWTIENMQDESGYFYYRKYRFFANKIPYMRWGESTMLLALAHLLEALYSIKK